MVMKTDAGHAHYWPLLGLVAAILCLPVLLVTYPPLVDYPNHLARVHILYHYPDVPAYQLAYTRLFEPIPNLASDLLVLAVLPWVNLLTAGKIFLTLSVLLFVAGCHLLGRAIHGGPTWLALPCCFFFYNSLLFYGFINYVCGVALFCLALAYWLKWREKWSVGRYLFVAGLVFSAYLAHLSAYCFLAVALVAITAWHYLKGQHSLRAAIRDVSLLLPPFAALVMFMRGSGETGVIVWNTMEGKLIGVLPLVLSYNYTLDVCLLSGLLIIGGLLILQSTRLRVHAPTWVTGIILFLLFILSPKVLFTSSGADARFILPAALLLVLSLKIEVARPTGRSLLLAGLAVLFMRVGFIYMTWAALDQRIAAQTQMLQVLPRGAKVYPLFVLADDRQQGKIERSFGHIIHYASINQQAFVPTLFARPGQQPLVFRTRPQYVEPPQGYAHQWMEMAGDWSAYLKDYEYVWSYGISDELRELLRQRATLIYETDGFTLWRLSSASRQEARL